MTKFEPINGREVQIGNFQVNAHQGQETEDILTAVKNGLDTAYANEYAHKIVRVAYQRGNSTFFIRAGFEENMYTDVMDYVTKKIDTEYKPIVFQITCFVTYNPPSVISDND